MPEAKTLFEFPARLMKRAPDEILLDLAKSRNAFDPSVFDEHRPFFFSAAISNGELDCYYTRMATSSLQNYAADADAGVSLQDSHWEWRLGLGRSLTGKYEKAGESEQVIADFYTVCGIKFNDATYQTTDDFINAIRAGIAKDVSIGFHGGEFVCSVCGLDMWSWDCWHIPGLEYDIKDKNGDVIRREEAFAWVAKARLAEVSVVYKGATPGAAILKGIFLSRI